MGENITLNADVMNASADGVFTKTPGKTEDTSENKKRLILSTTTRKPKRSFFDYVKLSLKAYAGSLAGSIWVVPIGTSAVTLGLYLSPPLPIFGQHTPPNWYPIVFGMIFSYITCAIVALFLCYFATAEGSNIGSYGLLVSRICQLEARLSVIGSPEAARQKNFAEYQRVALEEAYDNLVDLKNYLYRYPSGLNWVLGIGYIVAWGKLHSAEEALIEVEPTEMVIRGAMHDKLSIQDSKLNDRDELLKKLRQAIKELHPAIEREFNTYRPEEDNEEMHRLKHHIKEIAIKFQVDLDGDLGNKSETNLVISPEAEARARVTAREVRRTLNEFRDRLWEGVVRARNHLRATVFVTGFVTYLLLGVVIMSSAVSRDQILAATVFYIVGASMGLFSRIYRESLTSTAVDDYGLSLTRLIATPLLSGLAGVGGVLLFSTFVSESIVIPVANIFKIERPDYIIAAAFFGLTPNLIIRGLQQRSEKYISALKSSKGAVEETSN